MVGAPSISTSITYQWQRSLDKTNWTTIGGQSAAVLPFTAGATWNPVSPETYYRAQIVYTGAPDPVDVIELGTRGSLFLTRPAIMHYMEKREDLVNSANDLFEILKTGKIKSNVNHLYPLSEVSEAHKAIEARKTIGATVLIP